MYHRGKSCCAYRSKPAPPVEQIDDEATGFNAPYLVREIHAARPRCAHLVGDEHYGVAFGAIVRGQVIGGMRPKYEVAYPVQADDKDPGTGSFTCNSPYGDPVENGPDERARGLQCPLYRLKAARRP